MRRRSHDTDHRKAHDSDFLDDLDQSNFGAKRAHPRDFVNHSTPARTLSGLSDRRRWAPGLTGLPQRETPRDTTGRPARTVHKVVAPKVRRGPGGKPLRSGSVVRSLQPSRTIKTFSDVRKTIICAQRKIRKEVLHALKRTRAGKGARKRRNEYSDIHC